MAEVRAWHFSAGSAAVLALLAYVLHGTKDTAFLELLLWASMIGNVLLLAALLDARAR